MPAFRMSGNTADCWYIAAVIFGREFLIRKIERDEELINYLIDIERGFWYNNVLAGIMPEPDGSDNCSEMIAKMYFKGQENKTIKLSGYKEILDRRADLDKLIKKMEKEKKEIDQKIKMEMQDATVALEAGYKISWSNFEQNKLDTKKLKEEKPDIYKEYCKSSTNRRFTVSHAA